MSPYKKNIIANLVGKIWSTGLTFLLIPLYIKYLGIESYGLIGFYATLLGSFTVLDLGLSTTLNRELARATAMQKEPQEIRSLVFSLECVYWAFSILLACGIIVLAPVIGAQWIKSQTIPTVVVKDAIILMGIVIAFQSPIGIYNGGLLGLQKQVELNVIVVIASTIRSVGVFLLFIFFKPTIHLFFIWQAGTYLLQVIVMRLALWNYLPKSNLRAGFSYQLIKTIWRFAAGMTSIGLINSLLAQADKILLSKLLSLENYGYYILAFNVSSIIGVVVAPISYAVFPQLSANVSLKNQPELEANYHNACRLVTLIAFPLGLLLVFFPFDVLSVWMKDTATAKASANLVMIMTAGSLLNCLMVIPTILLMAYGNTRFIILQNTIALILILPLLFWWTKGFGPVGAAFVWLSLNAGYLVFSAPIILRKYVKGQALQWYIGDILKPLLPSLICAALIKIALHQFFPHLQLNLFGLAAVGSLLVIFTGIVHEPARQFLILKMKRLQIKA